MPRARTLKPGFFKNEDLVQLAFSTRLLFQGLWILADRDGRLEDRPLRIKMEIFPADDVDVDDALAQLAAFGFIERYAAAGKRVIQIVQFARHQSPHPKEPSSNLPAPPRPEPPAAGNGEGETDHLPASGEQVTDHLPATGEPLSSPAGSSIPSGPSGSSEISGSSGCGDAPVGARDDTPPEPSPSRKHRETPIPDDWEPGEGVVAWALGQGFEPPRIAREAERFRAHALAKDRRLVRWDQGFRSWLTSDYCAPPGAEPGSGPGPRPTWQADQFGKLMRDIRAGPAAAEPCDAPSVRPFAGLRELNRGSG